MPAQHIRNRTHLAEVVTRLGQRLQRKANRTARSKARITKLKNQLADERARLINLNARDDEICERDGTKIWLFCTGHPEIRDGQKSELGSGTASHRSQREGALEFFVDEATTVEEIRRRFPDEFDDVVATTYAVRKNALKREYRWLLDRLSTASAPAKESFTIHPLVTEEFFRSSVARLQHLAVSLGLMPAEELSEASPDA